MTGRIAVLVVLLLGFATPAFAYTDPGVVGVATQIGYMMVFALSSAVLFLIKPLKKMFGKKVASEEQDKK